MGLRHAIIGYRDNDIAGILENVVYLELLRRGYSVKIGKQGAAEVDFVADKGSDRLYVQVCYVLTPENTEREFAPLEAISDNYEKIVVSTDRLISFIAAVSNKRTFSTSCWRRDRITRPGRYQTLSHID